MAVFVPVAFYPGGIGIIYRQFALTIAFAIAISTFNALTFSPMMAGLLLKSEKPPKPQGWSWTVAGIVIGLAFGRFSAASFGFGAYIFGVLLFGFAGSRLASIFDGFNNAFHRLEQAYARLLKVLIDRRRLILMGLASGIVVTAIAFNALPSAFIPEEDQGYGLGIFQLQNGASLSQTQKVAEQIAKVLDEEEDIVSGSVISGAGFNGNSPDQGLFFYGFKPLEERSGASNKAPAIVARLNQKLSQFDTGLAVAAQPPAIPGFSAQGGFYFQFNDLSNGAYTFTQLNDLAQQLVSSGQASGEFSSLYTQFVPRCTRLWSEDRSFDPGFPSTSISNRRCRPSRCWQGATTQA